MKTFTGGAVKLVGSVELEDGPEQPESADAWAEQIHDRAETRTEILMQILEHEEIPSWHHGGLNE